MINAFESRLTDMLADSLSGVSEVQLVTRPRYDMDTAAPSATEAAVVVRVLTAKSQTKLGDDSLERQGQKGAYELRTMLYLSGTVELEIVIDPGSTGTEVEQRRATLMHSLDQLVLSLHNEEVRNGRAFQTGADLGFDLDGFRLVSIEPPAEEPDNFARFRMLYSYSGRFWPVETPAEGDLIRTLPTRIAVLPMQIPEKNVAIAGGSDITIPIHVDLRALNSASARLMARLRGASPPGNLVGDTTGMPPGGWVFWVPDSDGIFQIIYHPPASVSGTVFVGVSSALDTESGPRIALGDFDIEVRS